MIAKKDAVQLSMTHLSTSKSEAVVSYKKVNRKSDFLVILVATYNRLNLLKKALSAITQGTQTDHEIIVIDGGSTDGSIEFLKSCPDITPVFQKTLLGPARAYNEVWKQVECRYTCWLSDDTEVVSGSLDLAVQILENDPTIGMVGLKMKDTVGPWKGEPYMGSICQYGILNCNHGVLRMNILKSIGYLNQHYRFYGFDLDLTTSILSSGQSVVMTKAIGVWHHREWFEKETMTEKRRRENTRVDAPKIYHEKFSYLVSSKTFWKRVRFKLFHILAGILFHAVDPQTNKIGLNRRDWQNIGGGRFVSLFDPLIHLKKKYHWKQAIPARILLKKENPYEHLLKTSNNSVDRF